VWHNSHIREGAQIGRYCILGKDVYVDFDVIVGDNCKLQNGVYLYHPAELADGVFLGPGVIVTNDKRPRAVNPDMTLKTAGDWQAIPVSIGEGAAVGAGSIVLPGVLVGCWSMVGAGSVVTKDIRDHGLVAGNPARLVGYVCKCATRLEQIRDNTYSCPSCGETYEFKEKTVDPHR
jgi:acetyltransferase-like isoleucine patch superfamily enzyme